jgi:hypothetical protein
MATKKKTVKSKFPRLLPEEDFEVRDLQWAAAINCTCGYQHDVFVRYIEPEMVCPKCGRAYEVKLVAYEVENPVK